MAKPLRIRKKRNYKCPNPLFEQWLTEWKESAASKGLKTQYTFAKALSSLRKYPLPLTSGREAKILEFFGDKICSMLDDRLHQYNLEQNVSGNLNDPTSETGMVFCANQRLQDAPHGSQVAVGHVKGKSRQFVPCSVILPPVNKDSNNGITDIVDEPEDSFSFCPGTFDIVLCVDSMETSHSQSKKQFVPQLKKYGLQFEIRKLNVGDFLWIAKKMNGTASNSSQELVLDFVIERKRMDDLSHSIKDGRFREQKFRLKSCGLRHPIYLVENHGSSSCLGIPESTLEQAIVNTQVVDGFIVQRTQDVKESVAYLSSVSKYLENTLQTQTLRSGSRQHVESSNSTLNIYLTFEEFSRGALKNKKFCVREMFAKHLLNFHGLSVDRAAAFVDCYETPTRLFKALNSCATEEERIRILAEIKYGKSQRNLGQMLAKQLQQFYSTHRVLT